MVENYHTKNTSEKKEQLCSIVCIESWFVFAHSIDELMIDDLIAEVIEV